jgi:hypothetical protein
MTDDQLKLFDFAEMPQPAVLKEHLAAPGHFAIVPLGLLAATDIAPATKLLLASYCDRLRGATTWFRRPAAIDDARRCGLTTRTVRRARYEAVRQGYMMALAMPGGACGFALTPRCQPVLRVGDDGDVFLPGMPGQGAAASGEAARPTTKRRRAKASNAPKASKSRPAKINTQHAAGPTAAEIEARERIKQQADAEAAARRDYFASLTAAQRDDYLAQAFRHPFASDGVGDIELLAAGLAWKDRSDNDGISHIIQEEDREKRGMAVDAE